MPSVSSPTAVAHVQTWEQISLSQIPRNLHIDGQYIIPSQLQSQSTGHCSIGTPNMPLQLPSRWRIYEGCINTSCRLIRLKNEAIWTDASSQQRGVGISRFVCNTHRAGGKGCDQQIQLASDGSSKSFDST